MSEKFTFFWDGPFSQWTLDPFMIKGIQYNCPEQYMMAAKARRFFDNAALRNILNESNPSRQKSLGRSVKGYCDNRWQELCSNGKPYCWNVVYAGNFAKFQQNWHAWKSLQKTAGTTLVEASPDDVIWGIGLRQSDPRAQDRALWLGKNWLGEVLTEVREALW